MKNLSKKAAYIRGYKDALADAMTPENMSEITDRLLELIDEIADKIEELDNRVLDIELGSETIGPAEDNDEDDEKLFLDDDDEDDDDIFDEDYEDDDNDLFEIQCSECGEDFTISYDQIVSDDPIRCPHCNARMELDIDYDDEDDDDEEEND